MKKKQKQQTAVFTCLTLLKQDISELVHLFHNYLQDVEIMIDDLRILDDTQLEQFDAAYQAKSFVARGYGKGDTREDSSVRHERPFVELKMSRVVASLQLRGWDTAGKADPEVSAQMKKLLLRCQNRVHQFVIMCAIFMLFSLFLAFQPIAKQHSLDFVSQLFLELGGGLVLDVVAFCLFSVFVRLLKLERRIFLFPGMTKATRVYGRREMIGTVVLALTLYVLLIVIVTIAFRFLWK